MVQWSFFSFKLKIIKFIRIFYRILIAYKDINIDIKTFRYDDLGELLSYLLARQLFINNNFTNEVN